MDRRDVAILANRLMAEHGLTDLGWRLKFDNAQRRAGVCKYGERVIGLSLPIAELNPESEVLDTILHEIAHALTPRAGHGPEWQAKCREIGARPNRTYSSAVVAVPPSAYVGRCPAGHEYGRTRKPKGRQSCPPCGRARRVRGFSAADEITWYTRREFENLYPPVTDDLDDIAQAAQAPAVDTVTSAPTDPPAALYGAAPSRQDTLF